MESREHWVAFTLPWDDAVVDISPVFASGRPLGGLVHFASHPTVMGGVPVFSADYPGALTEALAARHGGIYGFLQGCTGNQWTVDMSRPGAATQRGSEHARRMGEALADYWAQAVEAGRTLESPRLRATRRVLTIPQRRATREQVELARWYLERAKPGVDQKAFTWRMAGQEYAFYQYSHVAQEFYCREMIGMWEWQRRTGVPCPTEDVEVQALAIGDMGIVGVSGEYFAEYGLRIKAESPFRDTLVVELANGWHGYIPTRQAFAHGGYETRFAYQSRLAPDAGDRICDAALAMLRELAPNAG